MTAEFRPDHTGVGEMLNSQMMQDGMLVIAEEIRVRAEGTSPIDTHGPHPGRYRASWHVRVHDHGGATYDRAEAVVYNDSPEAPFVEWGQWGNEPEHILARAAFVRVR
jgi:hypothetical protein